MRRFLTVLLLSSSAQAASAQGIRGTLTDAATGQPVPGVYVQALAPDGARVAATLSNGAGIYRLQVSEGVWRLRYDRVGYESVGREITVVARGWSDIALALNPRALVLPKLDIASKPRCGNPGEGIGAVHDLWVEVRKSLEAVDWSFRHADHGQYLTEIHTVDLDPDLSPRFSTATHAQTRVRSSVPFEVISAESAAVRGFATIDRERSVWYGPDAGVLLSPTFLDAHCFAITRPNGQLGLSFWPLANKSNVIDIRGVLWLDPSTGAFSAADFTYSTSDTRVPVDSAKGHVEFAINNVGRWTVRRWELRIPHLRFEEDSPANFRIAGYRRTTGTLLEGLKNAPTLVTATASITGRVSGLNGAPVAGALIRLIDTPYSTRTNSDGTYMLRGVPPGTYTITFIYPQAPTGTPLSPNRKRVELKGSGTLNVDLTYDR